MSEYKTAILSTGDGGSCFKILPVFKLDGIYYTYTMMYNNYRAPSHDTLIVNGFSSIPKLRVVKPLIMITINSDANAEFVYPDDYQVSDFQRKKLDLKFRGILGVNTPFIVYRDTNTHILDMEVSILTEVRGCILENYIRKMFASTTQDEIDYYSKIANTRKDCGERLMRNTKALCERFDQIFK